MELCFLPLFCVIVACLLVAKHFGSSVVTLEGPNRLSMGSKWAHFTCFGPFLAPKQPIFKAFWYVTRAQKWATTSLERATNTCFGIPCGPRSFSKTVVCLHPGGLADPFWLPPLWATSCSLLQPTGPRYPGQRVGWGNFEVRKPPKVGGCGWIRCAQDHVWSHLAQDMVCFCFGVVGGLCAQILVGVRDSQVTLC